MQAAMAEAFGMPRSDIAKTVGVSESAIKQWRRWPEYQDEVSRLANEQVAAVSEAVALLRTELVEGTRSAIRTLLGAMDAEDAKGKPIWSIRMDASKTLMQYGIEALKEDSHARAGDVGPTQAVQVVINTGDGPPKVAPE